MIKELQKKASKPADILKNHEGSLRLIGQYDADGICATAIAYKTLSRLGKDFEYEILKQLYQEEIERLAKTEEELLLFVDIGSGQSEYINEQIAKNTDKKVIISDHHEPQVKGDFHHLNPHFLGIDGGEALSAAGMTYILSKEIDKKNKDLVQLALIGATGDLQKQEGEFLGLNKELLKEAEKNDLIEKRKGLDLYGRSTKPLHKSLMYTSDPYLEGITNNESGAIQFLKSTGVEIRENGKFKTLEDLTEKEEKKIIHKLIRQGYDAEKLVQNIYILKNGHGIDEFSTIINACGRLGEPKKGVKILLENDLELAEEISRRYGQKISSALSFVEKNKENEKYIYEKNIGIIDAKNKIGEDFIGTVTTIAMNNGLFSSPVITGIAEADKNKIKISSRAKKQAVNKGLNLGEEINQICEKLDGEGGGHNIAAGAKIPKKKKDKFIDLLDSQIKNQVK